MKATPVLRLRVRCDAPVRPAGRFVLYWMTAARRTRSSFALERAVSWARELGRPLVVLEALRCDYPHASARIHRFVLEGMRDNARALARRRVAYHPYVEPRCGAGKGLLEALAGHAAVVVGDESPAFFLPRMLAAAEGRLRVRFETVDGIGIVPLRAAASAFPTAHAFRRFAQRALAEHLREVPREDPLAGAPLPAAEPLPPAVARRWPAADLEALLAPGGLGALPVARAPGPVDLRGGSAAGRARLTGFVAGGLARYAEEGRRLEEGASSGLSPYLHFGHVSTHEVLAAVAGRKVDVERLGRPLGRKQGFWPVSAPAEAFLDELVTWREVCHNMAAHRPGHDAYGSLPAWARHTLDRHRGDRRKPLYDRASLAAARTHDRLWNAAQGQLLRDGRLYNYVRMLWGKKVLEWSSEPEEALATMLELNDRYALDGRDPNSIAGIFWVLGRYDRAWGPERPVLGTVRYMSSASTARKIRTEDYMEAYAPER